MKKDKDYQYVDLGLPSGVLWATCNLGAENPWEFGDFYAWGETKSQKKGFFIDTYKWKEGYNKWPHRLSLKYDAAHQVMKGDWAMPWKIDFTELLRFTQHKWIENYLDSGTNGMLFIGPNGNELFFPAAGMFTDGDMYYRNEVATYLSNWSDTDIDHKRAMWTLDICKLPDYPSLNLRKKMWQGFSVRGVIEPSFMHICMTQKIEKKELITFLTAQPNREFCRTRDKEILCTTDERWINFIIYCDNNKIEPLKGPSKEFLALWEEFENSQG